MDKLKLSLTVLLAVLFTTAFLNVAYAQNANVDVHVIPEDAEIDVGESIKLDAFAFSLNSAANAPVKIDAITWDVEPDSMGTITDDGFFIAGRRAGIVKIKVTIQIGNHRIVRVVCIRIGRLPKPFFKVKIVPEVAVVPPGTEQQFEVVVTSLNGQQVRPKNIQWEVKPEDLGKIDEEGLFAAGDQDGRGKVVAVVQLDGLRIPASADVIVHDPPTGAISGNIRNDADNGPIGGAVIKAVRLGRIRWIQRAESDDAGNYLIGNLIPGRYILYANARGFIGEFYDNTRDYLQAFVLTVAEDDTLTDKDFGLSEGAKIAGTVTADSDSLEPLANAHVVAFLKLNPRVAKHATTNDDGAYEIGELETGAYLVAADAPGYGAELYDNAKTPADAEILNVQEPEKIEDIDFALGMASAISGVVKNAEDQEPIVGAHVLVFSHSPNTVRPDHRVFRETRTNENGEYLVQVRPGSYLAAASQEGFNTQFYDHVADRKDAALVQVKADSHTTDINFDLTKRGSIAGNVSDQSTGAPIAGAIVQAFKERNNLDPALSIAGFRAKTDDDGNYSIENVPSGKYLVVAAAEEYLPEFWEEVPTKDLATFVDVGESESKEGIDFTLETGGSISGTVASAVDSMPLAKALVQVWAADSRQGRRTFTNENGDYKFGGLGTGSYVVQVIADGFHAQYYENARTRDQADLVEVISPDETPGVDLFLHPQEDRQGTITGKLFSDKDDTPIFGGVVVAVSPRHRRPYITFSGPRGNYKLTDLPPGRYYVFGWARGFVGEFFDDARRFKDAEPVGVENGQVTEGIDFGLRPRHRNGTYTVRGRIRDAENRPLQGILIRAISGDGDVEVSAVTDASGDYALIDLPAGDYKVDASGVGYEDGYFGGTNEQNAASIAVGNGQDFTGANMNMAPDNVTSISDENTTVPDAFALSQNYPNPFNPETRINYQLSENSQVTLKIFNLLGQEVVTLVNEEQRTGVYTVKWNGKDSFGRQAATGIYIFQMQAGDKFIMSKRML